MIEDIEKRLEPALAGVAGKLVVEIAVALAPIVEQLAAELARDRVMAAFGEGNAQRDVKPPKSRAKKSPAPRKAKASGPTCRGCGEAGHNKRTCGKRESSDDAEGEG